MQSWTNARLQADVAAASPALAQIAVQNGVSVGSSTDEESFFDATPATPRSEASGAEQASVLLMLMIVLMLMLMLLSLVANGRASSHAARLKPACCSHGSPTRHQTRSCFPFLHGAGIGPPASAAELRQLSSRCGVSCSLLITSRLLAPHGWPTLPNVLNQGCLPSIFLYNSKSAPPLRSGCGAWRRQCSSCRCSSWPRDGPGRRRRPPLPSRPQSSAALRLLRWSMAGGQACGPRYRRRREQHSSSHDGRGARQREMRTCRVRGRRGMTRSAHTLQTHNRLMASELT